MEIYYLVPELMTIIGIILPFHKMEVMVNFMLMGM